MVFYLSQKYRVCLTNTARDVSKLSEASRDDEICKVTVNGYDLLIWRSSYDAIEKPATNADVCESGSVAVPKHICDLKELTVAGCGSRIYQYCLVFCFLMWYVLYSSRESSRSGKPVARADGLKVSVKINARDTFFFSLFLTIFFLFVAG